MDAGRTLPIPVFDLLFDARKARAGGAAATVSVTSEALLNWAPKVKFDPALSWMLTPNDDSKSSAAITSRLLDKPFARTESEKSGVLARLGLTGLTALAVVLATLA